MAKTIPDTKAAETAPDLPGRLLLRARDLTLRVPYYQPSARDLLTRPSQLISRAYTGGSNRRVKTILDGVSLDLHAGDRIGIIGINGSGKSSLLRMLARVYHPDSGTLDINGSVTGLFTITLGMNQEGTGLENIYLRGLQMGLTMSEVRERVMPVIEFAQIDDAIDRPINTYSTGMLLRLAFAISTMITPDILILDEWIGSGDAKFRAKADKRMRDMVGQTRGLILASHNTSLLQDLCNIGLVLDGGMVAYSGPLDDAVHFYDTEL
ncbi:MAG: ABC transporter ATP-binding protein [Litorimonas sp.]